MKEQGQEKEKFKPFRMQRKRKKIIPDTMKTGRRPPDMEAGKDTGR